MVEEITHENGSRVATADISSKFKVRNPKRGEAEPYSNIQDSKFETPLT